MKNFFRILIVLIILAMTLPTVIACADTVPTDETISAAETMAPSESAAETTAAETLYAPSDIPDDLRFDGTTINLLYWSDVPNLEFFVEDQSGEALNDAIFKRNANVQEQFGIELEYVGTPGNNGNQVPYVNACLNSTQSGADAHDIFCGYSMTGATIMIQGLSQDLTDYDIIEFDKPWWPKSLMSKATINGGIYFASGDISTNFLYMMYLIMFNKDMLADVHTMDPEVLYNDVYDGKWTLDRLIELSTGVYVDSDGDTTVSETDRYGVVATSVHFDPFYSGSNLRVLEVDEYGEIVLSGDLFSQKTVDLLEKLCGLLHTSGDAYIKKSAPVFGAGNALFLVDPAYVITRDIPNIDFSLGILPIPKYDENQDTYYTCLSFPYTMYMLSVAAPSPEAAAATLELMAYQSYLHVTPALFEETMKMRYADQSDDSFMFDYIRDGVVIDIGRIFTTQLDKMSYNIFRNAVSNNGAGSYISQQKTYERTLNKKIADINSAIKSLG